MAVAPLAALHRKLFDETDGNKFARLKDRLLKKHGADERCAVRDIFMAYAKEGQLLHWRNFLMTDIIALAEPGECGDFFTACLDVPELSYWAVDGMFKSMGKAAYGSLVALAAREDAKLSARAKAIKGLAIVSGQPFDRGLMLDPGHWKAEQLRLAEVLAWQADGYPDGHSFAAPATHPSLAAPQSALEKAAARLEKKLAAQRRRQQDLARPSNWLAIADPADLGQIDARWALPRNYQRFLVCYSPIRVHIAHADYFQGLNVYGAAELLKAQHGYAWNPVTQEAIAEWPEHYLVIADAGADPYCLDLDAISDGDAPVYTAEHGMGAWHFERHADSFVDFLNEIAAAA